MQLSICFAVLLALAPLAVDVAGPSDRPGSGPNQGDYFAASPSGVSSPTDFVDKLQHLRFAQRHLEAAGFAELAAQVGTCFEREVLSKQLAEKVAAVRQLQKEIDQLCDRLGSPDGTLRPPQQVMVQLKILQVSGGQLRNLGFDWSEFTETGIQTHAGFQLGVLDDAKPVSRLLEAMQSHGLAKVLAEPCVVTRSGRPATFFSGCERPVHVPGNDETKTIQFQQFGTKVDILPLILDSGKIRLQLRPEVRQIDESRSVVVDNRTVPGVRMYTIDTTVEVRPGQTVAISGLTQTGRPAPPRDQEDRPNQEPSEQGETELIVLATPQLVQANQPNTVRQATRIVPRYAVPVPVEPPQAGSVVRPLPSVVR